MKKKLIVLTILICSLFTAKSQDFIVKSNGDEIKARISDVSPTEVKYRNFDNPTGANITINKSDIFMIKYENGTKVIVKHDAAPSQSTGSSTDTQSPNIAGTIELGGEISYVSTSASTANSSSSSSAFSTFTFSPYVGYMVSDGLELGIVPSYTSMGSGSNSTSLFGLYAAPTYNLYSATASAYPYFGVLLGYSSRSEESVSVGGLGFGLNAGMKAQFGSAGLLLFGVKYISQSYSYNGVSETEGSFSVTLGIHIFISPKK